MFINHLYSWDYEVINQIKLFKTSKLNLASFSHFLQGFTEFCA